MDGIIGEIRLWASSFAPAYWMYCEGQTLLISQHTALFSVLGTTYGGDGVRTFRLPDLRGRVGLGSGQGPGLTPRVAGEMTGAATVTLTEAQLPAHRHDLPAGKATADAASPAGAHPAASESITPYASSPDAVMSAATVGSAGGGQPHENMQPYLAARYVICVNGLFPSRWY
jgi:microcystin-dependent protein